ncbi:unnamed protein product [Closterium sp. NIES-53]
MTTLRVLLHVAAQRDYELHSLDFSTAFLQGSLHEEIWLRRPRGFTRSFPPGIQWSLRRPVYGLRQAPREWHDTLRTTLAALVFAPSTADPSLFLRTDTSLPPFYVLVYVLQRFDFTYSSPQATPLSTRHSLSALPSDESVEPSGPYPELVGCLMYLMTCTRPDLAYPLSILARYVAPGRHRPEHMAAAKRVLRYLCTCFVLLDWSCDPLFSPTLPMGCQADESLWAHASSDLLAPSAPEPLGADPTTADRERFAHQRATLTAWKSRDAAACIALSSLLPESEETHFTQVRTASEFLTAIKAHYSTPTTISLGRLFLPFLFPDHASFEACTALPPPPPLSMAITIYFIVTSLPDRLATFRDTTDLTIEVLESALKDVESNLRSVASASGIVPPPLFHGCTVPQLPTFTASLTATTTDKTAAAVTTSARSRVRSGRRGGQGAASSGGGGGGVASGSGGSAGVGGAPRPTSSGSPAAAGGGDAWVRRAPAGLKATGSGALVQVPLRWTRHERDSFFLVVVDDYSRYTTIFPLAKKSDMISTLIQWLLATEGTRHRRVSCLHSDRGVEFCSGVLAGFCRERGILQSWTLPESPQQNGVAEHHIGLVMEIARTSMIHARAPHFLWPYAVRYAAHQLNLWPRISRPGVSPTSLWTGSPGVASRFHVSDSLAHVCNTSADKLSPCALPCIFLGFPEDSFDFTFYHPPFHRFLDSCDVRFDESAPYYTRYPCRGLPVPPPPLFLTSTPAPPEQPPPPPSVAPQVPSPSPQSSSQSPQQPSVLPPQAAADPEGVGFRSADPGGAASVGVGVGAESVPARVPGTGGAGVGAVPIFVGGSSLLRAGVCRAVTGGATTGGAGAPSAGPGEPGTGRLEEWQQQQQHQQQLPQQEQQQQPPPPQQQQQQQQRPPTPPVFGLWALGLPSPSPLSSPSPLVYGPTSPPSPSPSMLPSPPDSALTASLSTSVNDYYRTYRPVLSRVLASLVTDPRASLSSVSALTATVTEFAATRRLDYATRVMAAPPTSPLAVEGESALGCDALEDRKFELEFLAATLPHLCTMLLAPEGDPDALDIPTPRTYAEAVSGPWAS